MRLGWIGAHREGLPALRALLERDVPVEAVITLRPEAAKRRSGACDYRPLCERFGVPLHDVARINDRVSIALLRRLDLDLVFVIGWSQILGPEVLKLARVGMIGAHASLLPADRGRAPINWALIRGSTGTGNTLFWLSERVDDGVIIDQMPIAISPYDTCETLYRRVATTNRDMILRALPRLFAGELPQRSASRGSIASRGPAAEAVPGAKASDTLLPGRRPEDGLVDWTRPSSDVYNFVRALTRPYPGAFSFHGPERVTIWQCALFPASTTVHAQPGEVLGPVVSPSTRACGQVIACGDGGAVALLEIEDAAGHVIRGRALSELRWTGHLLTR